MFLKLEEVSVTTYNSRPCRAVTPFAQHNFSPFEDVRGDWR